MHPPSRYLRINVAEMHPPSRYSRINLAESKALMAKKLGPELFKQYFTLLNMFLSLKLTKLEFNKLCIRFIGRGNISLHNHLVRSILRNASTAKVPPPPTSFKDGILKSVSTTDIGYYPNGSHIHGGNTLSISPRKAKISIRDRKTSDLGRSDHGHNQTNGFNVMLENGDLQHHQETFARSPIRAPLGVQFIGCSRCRMTMGTANDSSLLDSFTLSKRMERIALASGLEGMSVDSADVLNHGLDIYLKGLIKSLFELVESRSEHKLSKCDIIGESCNNMKTVKLQSPVSLQDFKVSMEVYPQKLGEEWPVLLERICTNAFEE